MGIYEAKGAGLLRQLGRMMILGSLLEPINNDSDDRGYDIDYDDDEAEGGSGEGQPPLKKCR